MIIQEWRKAWRYLSVQASASVVALSVAYEYLPAMHQYLPEGWFKYAAALILVARIIKQKKVDV